MKDKIDQMQAGVTENIGSMISQMEQKFAQQQTEMSEIKSMLAAMANTAAMTNTAAMADTDDMADTDQ